MIKTISQKHEKSHAFEMPAPAKKAGKTSTGATVKETHRVGVNAHNNLISRLKLYFKVSEKNWFNSNIIKSKLETLKEKEIRELKKAFDVVGEDLNDKKIITLKEKFLIPIVRERAIKQFSRHIQDGEQKAAFEKELTALTPEQKDNIVHLTDSAFDAGSASRLAGIAPNKIHELLNDKTKVAELIKKSPPPTAHAESTAAAAHAHAAIPAYDKAKFGEMGGKVLEEMVKLDPKKRDQEALKQKYGFKESFFNGSTEKQVKHLLDKTEVAKGVAYLILKDKTGKPHYHDFVKNVEAKGKNPIEILIEAGKSDDTLALIDEYRSA
jgi:hypothetical protein